MARGLIRCCSPDRWNNAANMRRVLLAILLVLGLSPGVFLRDPPVERNQSQHVEARRLALPGGKPVQLGNADGPVLTDTWRLTSPNDDFGSYSALLLPGDGRLLAFSDRGRLLRMSLPPVSDGAVEIGSALRGRDDYKPLQDIEAATRDPESGRIWLAYEGRNAIVKLESDLSAAWAVRPAQMQRWPVNGGPEAMVRLRDGRFVVLAESARDWRDLSGAGLLFAADPTDGAVAQPFVFNRPAGFNPTDMAQLPDGRVLILLRGVKLGLPPHFMSRLVLADPATIRAGEPWDWESVTTLDPQVPNENYEGLAVEGGKDGAPLVIWLISDDNGAEIIQRTLLTRLEWQVPTREKARENAARPDNSENQKPG